MNPRLPKTRRILRIWSNECRAAYKKWAKSIFQARWTGPFLQILHHKTCIVINGVFSWNKTNSWVVYLSALGWNSVALRTSEITPSQHNNEMLVWNVDLHTFCVRLIKDVKFIRFTVVIFSKMAGLLALTDSLSGKSFCDALLQRFWRSR